MKTKRLLSLWKIKSNAKRRAFIVVSLPVFFVGNLILSWAAWTAAVCLLWWANQKELFRSAAHYWRTDERIDDVTDATPEWKIEEGLAINPIPQPAPHPRR